MKPSFCVVFGCIKPGLFDRPHGRVCGDHFGLTTLSRRDAVEYVRKLVPHGMSHRIAIVNDAAGLLLGESKLPDHPRANFIRGQALALLRGVKAATPVDPPANFR